MKKALPRVIGATRKDGTYRYGEISIVKNGDTVFFYDHTTGNLSRPMSTGEATAVLQSERRASEGRRYAFSDVDSGAENVYNKEQYERFGWAREAGGLTKNEMDDLESKIKLKRSVKDFYRSEEGEFIVPVNDDPHARLKVNNVFVFLEGTKRRNTITRVVRFEADMEMRMEEISDHVFRERTFDSATFSVFEAFSLATEYRRRGAPSFEEYRKLKRLGKEEGDGPKTDSSDRFGDQRRGAAEGAEGDGSGSVNGTRQALPDTASAAETAGSDTDTTAPKTESTVREIEAWAKENVKRYGELLPNEKRET